MDEPVPPQGEVQKPATLSPGGLAVWERLAPIVTAMRLLTVADGEAFKGLCELQATLDLAIQEKAEPGFKPFVLSVVIDGAGNERPKVELHPALRLERDTAAALRPYYDYFGLNATGRARMSVPKAEPEQPVSKWAGVLA